MERRLFDACVPYRKKRRAISLPVSLAVHAVVVGGALIVPLLGDATLPEVAAAPPHVFFTEPVVPPPPLPPPGPATGPVKPSAPPRQPPSGPNGLIAPPAIPDVIPDEPFDITGPPGGGGPGVDGGAPWGAVGAIVEGLPPAPAVTTKPIRASSFREPRKLRYVPPVYPPLAIKIGLQGTVVVECTIDTQGRVVDATVVEGNPLLNDAAKEAVLQWRYTPTLLNGMPVPVLLRAAVTFTLQR